MANTRTMYIHTSIWLDLLYRNRTSLCVALPCLHPTPTHLHPTKASAVGVLMANKPCLLRLRKELRTWHESAPPFIRAAPLETNMQEWHYVLQGPPDSPYEGGLYHGKLRFPDDFPFKPPAIYMITPNGRFDTNRRLCLSMSDFHPETWVPTWSVATILNGVLSFMVGDEITTGAVQTSLATKTRYRDAAAAFNDADETFCKLFPELVGGALFTHPEPPSLPPPPDESTADEPTADCEPTAVPADASSATATASDAASDAATADALGALSVGGEGEGDGTGEGEGEATGRHAVRNRKKREKAAAKKRAAAAVAAAVEAQG